MATRTDNRRPKPYSDQDVEMTIFGRLWRPQDWLIPPALWSLVLLIAGIVHEAQQTGRLPAGGSGFFLGCLVLTVLAMACGLMLGGHAEMSRPVTVWCLALPLCGGSWIWLASIMGMTSGWTPWVMYAACGVLLSISYRMIRDIQRKYEFSLAYDALDEAEEEERKKLQDEIAYELDPTAAPDPDKARWEEFMAAAGLPGMIFWARRALLAGTGFVLHFELPEQGVSYSMVEQAAERMELQLSKKFRHYFDGGAVHPGCVRVERAKDEKRRPVVGEVLVYVDVVDVLANTLNMPSRPEDYTPISIMEAFQVGEFVDGTAICLTLHEIHVLIIGQTQHGKSNLLHVMVRQLARCYDVVLWGLDFKGGDTIRLWMNPYMNGEIDPHTDKPLAQCIFDWVGVDDHIEAERMMLSALAAAKGRPAIAGGGGWVPSRERPAILFLADEISEVVGQGGMGPANRGAFHVSPDVLSGLLSKLMKLGTGQGVYVVTASQRATVGSVGSGEAKSQQKGRILLPVTEGASDVLQGSGPEAIRLAKTLEHKGSVVIEGWSAARGKPGKIWLAGLKSEIKEKIRHEVLQLTHLRDEVRLDAGTEALILQYGYADRPGGPTPDPDRLAWYFGRPPQRQMLTWDYEYGPDGQPMRTGGVGSAAAVATASAPTSTAAALGFDDVPSVFAGQARDTSVEASGRGPASVPLSVVGGKRGGHGGQLAADWEARNQKTLQELGLLAEPVADDPAPVADDPPLPPAPQPLVSVPPPAPGPFDPRTMVPAGQQPTYENSQLLMIYLIHEAGSSGLNGAALFRRMADLDFAPSRTALYPWMDRLVRDTAKLDDPTKKVIKEGSIFLTSANKPMPRQMAS